MKISCWWVRPKLTAYASTELPETLAQRVEAHLAGCPACQAELGASVRLAEALRVASPAAASPNPYLWERLEAAIHAEQPAPQPSPFRRLAPLGSVALAGAALAAVALVRPAFLAPRVAPAPVSETRVIKPVPTPAALLVAVASPPSAVVAARQVEKLEPVETARDPFTKVEPERPARRLSLPAVVRHRSTQRRVKKTLPTFTSGQAVELVEVGTQHVVEVVHTEALNRMVTETQKDDIMDKSRRAVCTPADATAIAQNTRSLFQ